VLKQRDAKLAEAQQAQADLIRKQRELDDAKREMALRRPLPPRSSASFCAAGPADRPRRLGSETWTSRTFMAARHAVEYSTYPRGPLSGPGCSVPVRHHLIGPIRPTRRRSTISPHGGLYAMPWLCGSA
jgi:hypothetical protein